jgi:diguanylate cyclase (GGDEF)-like protein/PAS domain S-box-containing protein
MSNPIRKKILFFNFFTSWPNGLSLLEITILLVGIAVGVFMYQKMNQIRTDSTNASAFDQQTSQILLSVNLAYIHFDELIAQTPGVDLQKDIYNELDNAENLCQNLDKGGPGGKFVPLTFATKSPDSPRPSICTQLTDFRKILNQRWQDHLDGKIDSKKSVYIHTFSKLLQDLQRFDDVADPHIQNADIQTKRVNLGLSISLAAIFWIIVIILWRTRKTLTKKTIQLEKEIAVSTQLNTELDTERNLLNTLLDALPDAVFAKNIENHFIKGNSAAALVMGLEEKEELIGKSEIDFQPEDIGTQVLAHDAMIFTTGESTFNEEEKLIDLKTGKPCWRQTTKVALHDRTGKIIGLVGISRDITKQKETEAELQKTNTKLIQGIAALEQSTLETERLSEMVDLLQACPNTEEACVVISDQMNKFFPEDSGILYLFHSSRNILDRAASWGSVLPDTLVFKPDECWGLRRGKMHIVEADKSNADHPEINKTLICPHIVPDGLADYLCVPLVAQGEALGLLHLRHKEGPVTIDEQGNIVEWYGQTKRQRIQSIVDSLSLSLANLKLQSTLRQQSIRDPLTGMYNRRYMEVTLEREVMRAARTNENVGVIMLDIDHFKEFNDTFGHQAGDVLLQSLGHFFLSHVRGDDVACRYGGEEFLLLLPGSTVEETRQRAEEMREKVHFMNVDFKGQALGKITLSFGVSAFPNHGITPDILIQTADQALYLAKTKGRDQVVVART